MKTVSHLVGALGLFVAVATSLLFVTLSQAAGQAQAVNRSKAGVAIEGYDPVEYFTGSRAAKGTPAFEFDLNGTRYWFVSAANRDRFAKSPETYLPQYGGFCAYAVSRGYTAIVDPEAWSVVRGKLYLNYSKRVKALWERATGDNIEKGDRNWPALRDKPE